MYPALSTNNYKTLTSECLVTGTTQGPDAAVQFLPSLLHIRKVQALGKVQKVPQRGSGGHQHSYLISVWPPALRAICTSSFPYLSSAWALQGQTNMGPFHHSWLAMAPKYVQDPHSLIIL